MKIEDQERVRRYLMAYPMERVRTNEDILKELNERRREKRKMNKYVERFVKYKGGK